MKTTRTFKPICLILLLLFAGSAAFAQGKWDAFPKNEKWFLMGGAGIHGYVGDYDSQISFGERFGAGGEIAVGKWIAPAIAVRLQLNALHAVGGTKSGKKESWNYGHAHVDAMLNLSELAVGADEERLYSAIPFMGIGVARRAARHNADAVPTLTIGLLNSFRMNEHLCLNIEGKGSIVGDKLDGLAGGRSGEGTLTLTVGMTYNF